MKNGPITKTQMIHKTMSEKQLKEEALKNAELMSDEEVNSIRPVEEVIESALREFNQLADEIDRELEEEWSDYQGYEDPDEYD